MDPYSRLGDRNRILCLLYSERHYGAAHVGITNKAFSPDRSCAQMLINYRNQKLQEFADANQPLLLSLLYLMMFNLAFALGAALLTVYLEPAAASDGIAEIKGLWRIFF